MDSSLAAVLVAAVFRSDASCGNNLHFGRLISRDDQPSYKDGPRLTDTDRINRPA